MNCNVKTKELKAALKLHRLTIIGKNTWILSGVRLELKDSLLKVHSTDLENTMLSILQSEVFPSNTRDNIVVSYKVLKNIIDNHDEESVGFEVLEEEIIEDEIITLKEGYYDEEKQLWINDVTEIKKVKTTIYKLKAGKFTLETLNADEFPEFPKPNTDPVYTEIDWPLFIETLNKIKEFPTKDQSRVILTAFHCDCKNNCIVATDSYKLAKIKFDFNCKDSFNLSSNGYKVLKDLKARKATISFAEGNIYFNVDNHIMVTRNLTGKFPEYNQLIPDDSLYQFSFKSEDMIKQLTKLSKVFNDLTIPVKLTFFNKEVKIEMTVKETGTYEDSIPCDINPDLKEPITMAFNTLQMRQCLVHETTIMHVNDPLKPVIIKENNDEIYLLMPIRMA